MMGSNTTTADNADEAAANFRAFTRHGYAAPIASVNDGTPTVVYFSVSVMSVHFTSFESMMSMIVAAHKLYGSRGIPVIYICADTLQRNTREVLHGDTSSKQQQPEERARKNWFTLFDQVIGTLKEKGIEPLCDIVDWDTFLGLPDFSKVHHFVETLLLHARSADELSIRFPEMSSEALSNLNNDILDSGLRESIKDILRIFTNNNLRYFGDDQRVRLRETFNGDLNKEDQCKTKRACFAGKLNKRVEIGFATRRYLAEEFSVFMLLACLNNSRLIQNSLKLNWELTDQVIQPMLSYPISASVASGAELTFTAFNKVSALYLKYAAQLALPVIDHELIVADVLVPKKDPTAFKKARALSDGGACSKKCSKKTKNNELRRDPPFSGDDKHKVETVVLEFANGDSRRLELSVIAKTLGVESAELAKNWSALFALSLSPIPCQSKRPFNGSNCA